MGRSHEVHGDGSTAWCIVQSHPPRHLWFPSGLPEHGGFSSSPTLVTLPTQTLCSRASLSSKKGSEGALKGAPSSGTWFLLASSCSLCPLASFCLLLCSCCSPAPAKASASPPRLGVVQEKAPCCSPLSLGRCPQGMMCRVLLWDPSIQHGLVPAP